MDVAGDTVSRWRLQQSARGHDLQRVFEPPGGVQLDRLRQRTPRRVVLPGRKAKEGRLLFHRQRR
jgi:hypothetical protein